MPEVRLRPWADGDLALLTRTVGNAGLTRYLGGPESPEKIRERPARYLALGRADAGRMLVILAGGDETPAGTHGYWRRDDGALVTWETGGFRVPDFQWRGVGRRA